MLIYLKWFIVDLLKVCSFADSTFCWKMSKNIQLFLFRLVNRLISIICHLTIRRATEVSTCVLQKYGNKEKMKTCFSPNCTSSGLLLLLCKFVSANLTLYSYLKFSFFLFETICVWFQRFYSNEKNEINKYWHFLLLYLSRFIFRILNPSFYILCPMLRTWVNNFKCTFVRERERERESD